MECFDSLEVTVLLVRVLVLGSLDLAHHRPRAFSKEFRRLHLDPCGVEFVFSVEVFLFCAVQLGAELEFGVRHGAGSYEGFFVSFVCRLRVLLVNV